MATLRGTSGLVWGLSSETAALIQSVSITDAVEEKSVRNHEGDEVGVSLYNRTQNIAAEFYFTGSGSGLGAVDPAEAVTLANYTPSAGLILATEVKTELQNQDYKKVSISAKCRPLITS